MARVESFQFASDDTYTDATSCTIDWTNGKIVYQGYVPGVPFSLCDELVTGIEDLIEQDESDGIIETEKLIVGGPTLKYNAAVNPRTVSAGTIAWSLAKAQDFADGVRAFVLDELAL